MKKLIYIFLFVCSALTAQNGAASLQLSLYQQQQTSTPPAINYYINNDAAGDDSNSIGGWHGNSVETSVVSTDTSLGDNYALRFESDTASTYRRGDLDFTGLTIGVEYVATIRTRRLSGDGGIFNWKNVSGASYDITYIGTDWVEGTVVFTPTASTIEMRIYSSADIGLTGSAIEVSSIIINEN